ncbi:ABC transporter ATP-binding protein [Aeromicrobium sp. CF4.19]|uniref:ABC transporter ATP-binding protein n=1 Tax=Aeromicrobium sp. CF4.19 TaxID=3373082 RepID=UPI003EE48CF1
MTSSIDVRLTGIEKRFPGVVANHDVDIHIRPGAVHALIGENGAGKSTLMKILYGVQQADGGTIEIDGRTVELDSPVDAIDAGIGMVFQHFMLADNLTVLENIVLGAEKVHGIGERARREVLDISERFGFDLRPDELVEQLGVADRQRVEITKVLYRGARLIILDEPTAVLVPQEVERLFGNLRELVAEGCSVLFISHKLDEVLQIADDITAMRRGTTVGTADPSTTTKHELAELMVGSELPSPQTTESTVTETVVLSMDGVTLDAGSGRALLDHVSLDVHAGEVVGVAGVEGNGQVELVEVVMGMRRARSGTITLQGADISRASTRQVRDLGVGFVPEDRHRHGLLLDFPLWENRVLGHQHGPPTAKGPLIDAAGARRDSERIIEQYDVRTPGVDTSARALSGGNQQKFIVGREMSGDPVLLVASHPTRGVDVGAQAAIWDHVRAARHQGLGVLLISADLDELIGLSDRLVVILRGRLTADIDPQTVTAQELGQAMTGGTAA